MKVGWIGMGRIGKQMALRVIAGGHDLVGHARTPAKHADMAALCARIVPSLTETVAGAHVVCVNVYDEVQLLDAVLDGGVLAAMASGAVLAIHSTVGPAIIQEIAGVRSDIRVIDAPFSGKDVDAAAGTIALMVGGAPDDLAAATDVLGCYADYIQHMGPLGAGATIKLVNNALFGAQALLAHDALAVLTGAGIAQADAVRMIDRSSGSSFAMRQFGASSDARQMLSGIWPYIQKDVAISRAAAAESGFDLGMLDIATRPYQEDAP